MSPFAHSADPLHLMHAITTRLLREEETDLSARQMAILLSVYLTPPPHTVKRLSERLPISKPAVCRALDTLAAHQFIRRSKDSKDSRIVIVERTLQGADFLARIAAIVSAEMSCASHAIKAA